MPIYKSPIRPYDPVVQLPGTSVFQYIRDSFYGAGQDSYTVPFAQNQELFSSLRNLMPVTNGVLQLRYGYQLFNNPGIGAIQRLYGYQNNLSGVRKLLLISGTAIDSCNEDGTSASSVLTSSNSNPRAIVARDYAFFPAVTTPTTWPSGAKSDGKKWNSTSGVTDWGLDRPSTAVNVTSTASAGNVTMVSTVGRVYAGAWQNSTTGHYSDINVGVGSFASGVAGAFFPTVDAQTSTGATSWLNIGNINANDGVFATAALPNSTGGTTEFISGTGFGFAIPGTATIYGIQVTLSKKATSAGNPITDLNISLLKAGVATGSNKADTVSAWPTGITAFNYGGSTDLWGTTWTPADINNANFGVGLSANLNGVGGGGSFNTASLDYFAITVTYATGAGANTGAITSKQVNLALPTNNPTGADKFNILGTLDGGDTSTLYIVATVPAGTATYIDNTPDNVLVTNNVFSEIDDFGFIHGGQDNDFPPLGLQFPIKYRGRVFGGIQSTLYFSKNLDEVTTSTGLVVGRFEEAWPPTNTMDVSTQHETIRGLMTDGDVLYIGTERHIWRLSGDSPANFSKPEIVFNEVGILNQDVWSIVFAEGAPMGMIWMTPDRRVIMSNFGNYQDIGTPIQDVLNTLNLSASSAAWASFFSEGAYDLYILAIPTGANTTPDTFCVLDLRVQRWFIWTPTDQFASGLFNINASGTPQWLMGASTGKVYQFLSTATQDRVSDTPVAISPSIQTPWMHLGSPTMVKALNEIEVITGDTGMTMTVDGASIFSQTTSPNNVVTGASLSNSPRGFKKLYLAGNTSKDRFYRFTFNGTGTAQNVLEGFTIEAVPIPY